MTRPGGQLKKKIVQNLKLYLNLKSEAVEVSDCLIII